MTFMAKKIKANNHWAFFKAYHDSKFILRHDNSKNVPLRQKRESTVYRLDNKSQKEVVVYKIDGGLIVNNNGKKCDYGIYTEDDMLFLIELKGDDLNYALKQINQSINILLEQPNIKVKKLSVRIVLSKVRTPEILESEEKKLKQKLHKLYGGGDYLKKSQFLKDII